MSDGREVYLAWCKQEEIFRSGEKTVSDALRAGKAQWAIDYDTLIRMRTEGVYIVGILVKETGDIFLTTLKRFIEKGKVLDYSGRGGALQRYLPISDFTYSPASTRIK